jgi:hypothetical protein
MAAAMPAVEQADAEEQEGRRHAPEKKILERGFRRLPAAFVESGEGIERQTQQLERRENHQQVLRADEKHHRGGREEDEAEVFANVCGEGGVEREQHGEDGEGNQHRLHQLRQRARDQHAVVEGGAVWPREKQQNCTRAADAGDHYADSPADREARLAHGEQVDGEGNECGERDDDFRQREPQQFEVVHRIHRQAPVRRLSKSGELSAGMIRSSSSRG